MTHPKEAETILARTWNGNESGTLWTAEWYRVYAGDSATFWCRSFVSGVFVPTSKFPDETAFWAAYKREAEDFHGHVED